MQLTINPANETSPSHLMTDNRVTSFWTFFGMERNQINSINQVIHKIFSSHFLRFHFVKYSCQIFFYQMVFSMNNRLQVQWPLGIQIKATRILISSIPGRPLSISFQISLHKVAIWVIHSIHHSSIYMFLVRHDITAAEQCDRQDKASVPVLLFPWLLARFLSE